MAQGLYNYVEQDEYWNRATGTTNINNKTTADANQSTSPTHRYIPKHEYHRHASPIKIPVPSVAAISIPNGPPESFTCAMRALSGARSESENMNKDGRCSGSKAMGAQEDAGGCARGSVGGAEVMVPSRMRRATSCESMRSHSASHSALFHRCGRLLTVDRLS